MCSTNEATATRASLYGTRIYGNHNRCYFVVRREGAHEHWEVERRKTSQRLFLSGGASVSYS